MVDFSRARRSMVDSQLRTNKVTDPRLLTAFETVPRELFVEPALADVAYCDEDMPCGVGRWLMEPFVAARLLQSLGIGAGDVVLDVGCGTGYEAAIIAHLAATVVGLESDPALVARANALMTELAIDNAVIVEGDLVEGHSAQAPYDAIFVSGAVAEVPESLLGQLGEGGRLGAVCVTPGCQTGSATLFLRRGGVVSSRKLFDAAVPLLPGFEPKPGFVF
jgi:protein-L-isoaspartate(D-aspartate) O-methyltransferase